MAALTEHQHKSITKKVKKLTELPINMLILHGDSLSEILYT